MSDNASPLPSFGSWQLLFPRAWVRPRLDGDWDLLILPWRTRPFRYSTAELADYQAKTDRAISSLLTVIILYPPGIVACLLLLRGEPLSFGGVVLEPGFAEIIAFCILLILSGIFIYRRNRPAQRHPPRTEPVPFRERWPLIQWWVLDLNRWAYRGVPTSRWGSIAFVVLCAVLMVGMAWLLIAGRGDNRELASWKLWLMLFIWLYGIFHTIWLRQLRRRWGDIQPPRWKAPES
jgi:hypothetical protein